MSLSVKFNGNELSEYIDVLQGFTPFSGANWAPEVINEDGITKGTEFKYTTYKSKTIPMPFTVSGNINGKYDELQKILNVNEPKELVFGNTPDRFCYAIPIGDLDFEDWECLGEGTITWLVPDGLAHSTVEKTFSAATNSSGVLEATIVNGGTEAVPIDYTITHNHENGYIGIVSEHGVIQLGSPDEVDTEIRQKSQVLVNYRNAAEMGNMTDGQGVLTENFPKNGSFKTVTINGQQVLAVNSVGSGSSWHGASKMVTLPADSNGEVGAVNFLAQSHIWFETGRVQQTGLLEFVVGDEAGQHLASIHIFKKATNANRANAIMQINLQEMKRVIYEPHYKSVTANGGSKIYIRKSGELFEFYFGGSRYQFRVPSLANRKAKTLTIFLGQWGTLGAGNVVSRMYFHNVMFQKDNVGYWYDIPNRYRAGSTVYVDGSATKVYVDGIPSLDDEMLGSTYFLAPPGETRVQFYYSSFSNPGPTVTAKIREAYL